MRHSYILFHPTFSRRTLTIPYQALPYDVNTIPYHTTHQTISHHVLPHSCDTKYNTIHTKRTAVSCPLQQLLGPIASPSYAYDMYKCMLCNTGTGIDRVSPATAPQPQLPRPPSLHHLTNSILLVLIIARSISYHTIPYHTIPYHTLSLIHI